MSQSSPPGLSLQKKPPSQETHTGREGSGAGGSGDGAGRLRPHGDISALSGLSLLPGEVTAPWASCESENLSFLFSHGRPNGSKRRQTETNLDFLCFFEFGLVFFLRHYSGEGPAATQHSLGHLLQSLLTLFIGNGGSLQPGTAGREHRPALGSAQGSGTTGMPPGLPIPVLQVRGLTAASSPRLTKLEISSEPKSCATPPHLGPGPSEMYPRKGKAAPPFFEGKPWERVFVFNAQERNPAVRADRALGAWVPWELGHILGNKDAPIRGPAVQASEAAAGHRLLPMA